MSVLKRNATFCSSCLQQVWLQVIHFGTLGIFCLGKKPNQEENARLQTLQLIWTKANTPRCEMASDEVPEGTSTQHNLACIVSVVLELSLNVSEQGQRPEANTRQELTDNFHTYMHNNARTHTRWIISLCFLFCLDRIHNTVPHA